MEEFIMNQIVKRPLFSNLSELHQALDRIFEPSFAFDRENWLSNVVSSNWSPTIDI